MSTTSLTTSLRQLSYEVLVKAWPLPRGDIRWMELVRRKLRVPPYARLKRLPVGRYRLLLDPADFNDAFYYFKLAQGQNATLIRHLLSPGDCVVDAGANVGHFAAVCADAVGPSGQVHAIEPNPDLTRRLQTMASEVPDGPLRVHPVALWSSTGRITFHQATVSGWSSLNLNYTFEPKADLEVEALSLDDFVARLAVDRIQLLKLDLEGAETDVLLAARSTLESGKVRTVMVEAEPHRLKAFGHGGREIPDLMEGSGYRAVAYVAGRHIGPVPPGQEIPESFSGDIVYVRSEEQGRVAARLAPCFSLGPLAEVGGGAAQKGVGD